MSEQTDNDRRDFLQALDAAAFEVNAWEADFLETALKQASFSFRQRMVIGNLIIKYGGRLRWQPKQTGLRL